MCTLTPLGVMKNVFCFPRSINTSATHQSNIFGSKNGLVPMNASKLTFTKASENKDNQYLVSKHG